VALYLFAPPRKPNPSSVAYLLPPTAPFPFGL
jgi:hypothetical protein